MKSFTIFVDSISKKAFTHFQHISGAEETILGKRRLENLALRHGVTIKAYRADNGVFNSKKFMNELAAKSQDITFAAVEAHEMNGVAERLIRTISTRARTALLYASSKHTKGMDPELWTFAVKHSVDTWNQTPRQSLNYQTPNAIFANTTYNLEKKSLHQLIFRNLHPFRCPVYVLDIIIQSGQKIPRWEPRTRTCIYLGQSLDHAQYVSLVLNPLTGHISPQYHIVYDDNFETLATANDPTLNVSWDRLATIHTPIDLDITVSSSIHFDSPPDTPTGEALVADLHGQCIPNKIRKSQREDGITKSTKISPQREKSPPKTQREKAITKVIKPSPQRDKFPPK